MVGWWLGFFEFIFIFLFCKIYLYFIVFILLSSIRDAYAPRIMFLLLHARSVAIWWPRPLSMRGTNAPRNKFRISFFFSILTSKAESVARPLHFNFFKQISKFDFSNFVYQACAAHMRRVSCLFSLKQTFLKLFRRPASWTSFQ